LKVIHDPITEAVQQASADQTPLGNREGVAEVPLTGLLFRKRTGHAGEVPGLRAGGGFAGDYEHAHRWFLA
jgi:hypothetical protein